MRKWYHIYRQGKWKISRNFTIKNIFLFLFRKFLINPLAYRTLKPVKNVPFDEVFHNVRKIIKHNSIWCVTRCIFTDDRYRFYCHKIPPFNLLILLKMYYTFHSNIIFFFWIYYVPSSVYVREPPFSNLALTSLKSIFSPILDHNFHLSIF